MIPCCHCPDPKDKEAWRQYTKCTAIAAIVGLVLAGLIFILIKL
jgi:hypothetical protein